MATRIWVREGGDDLSQVAKQVQRANREAHLNTENNNELSERVTASVTAAITPVSTGGNPDTQIPLNPAANRRGVFPMHAWLYDDYSSSTGVRTLTIYSPDGGQSVSWTEGSDVIREATYPWEDWGSAGDEGISSANKGVTYASRIGQVVLPVGQNSFIYARQKLTNARAAQYVTRYDSAANTFDSESQATDYSYIEKKCVLITPTGVRSVDMPAYLATAMATIWPAQETTDIYLSLQQGSYPNTTQHKWLWNIDSTAEYPGKAAPEPLTSFGLDWNSYSEVHNTPPIYWYLDNYTGGVDDWYAYTPEEIIAAFPNAQYGRAKTAKWIRPRYVDVDGGYEIKWYQQPTYDNGYLPDLLEIRNFGRYKVKFQEPSGHQQSSPYLLTCWDAGIGSVCRQLALNFGFSSSDLAI